MQPNQISSDIEQSEQNTLIQIAQRRNQANATPKDVRNSDRAISKLFHAHKGCLIKLAKHVLGRNADEYFDVALDGFQKAIESFKFIGSFSSWMAYKVKKALLDQKRQPEKTAKARAVKNLVFLGNQDLEEIAPHQSKEDLSDIEAALSQLTDYEQKIIWMHTQGYSWPEIGQVVGKSLDAARIDMRRAILSVRKILGINVVVEKKSTQPKKPAPIVSWMRRLWNRFQEMIRVGVKSDDIRLSGNSQITLVQCPGQPSNLGQSGILPIFWLNFCGSYLISERCPRRWAICRGVANDPQAPPKSSIPNYLNSFRDYRNASY
jgi:RNA polymerase sigma factor (sigma-70 family)